MRRKCRFLLKEKPFFLFLVVECYTALSVVGGTEVYARPFAGTPTPAGRPVAAQMQKATMLSERGRRHGEPRPRCFDRGCPAAGRSQTTPCLRTLCAGESQ